MSDKISQQEEEIEQNEASIHALEEQMNPTTVENDVLPETLVEVTSKIEQQEAKRRILSRKVDKIETLISSYEECRKCNTCLCDNRYRKSERRCKHKSYDGLMKHRLPVGKRRYVSIDKPVARLTKRRQAIEEELMKIPNEIDALREMMQEIKRNGSRVRARTKKSSKTDKQQGESHSNKTNSSPQELTEEEDFCDLDL